MGWQIPNSNLKNEQKIIENAAEIVKFKSHTTDVVAHHSYAVNTSSNDSYTVTIPGITEYKEGMEVTFKATVANTTGATIDINNLGAKNIYKNQSTVLETGDILVNQLVQVTYTGGWFQLTSIPSTTVSTTAVQKAIEEHSNRNPFDAHSVNAACRVYNDVVQSIANAVSTKLTFNSEHFDTGDMHNSADNGKLICRTPGKYFIEAQVKFVSHATGHRELMIKLNGNNIIAYETKNTVSTSFASTALTASTVYELKENDYLEVFVFQNSGVAVNIAADVGHSAEFSMVRVG